MVNRVGSQTETESAILELGEINQLVGISFRSVLIYLINTEDPI